MRNLVKIAVLATFAVVGFALSVNQSAWADLDDLFDQDKSQRDNAWRQMEEHKNKDQSKHKEPRRGFLNSAPPLPTILS
ncbi:MAG: hypothetical protein NZT92_17015, partial [Abditibacteriales bacterium]|nr:hypothetical protein [Abditibacteriales bacterium]